MAAAAAGLIFNVIGIDVFITERTVETLILLQLVSMLIVVMLLKVWRDTRIKEAALIAIQNGTLTLNLPADRSHVARHPAIEVDIPLGEIDAVETRLEDFGVLLMVRVQRAYSLTLRTRPSIFLFDARTLGDQVGGESMQAVAAEIALRAGVPFKDLGMVDGRAGLLGLCFTSVPFPRSTASLTQVEQRARWAAVNRTTILAAAVVLLWTVVRSLLY